MLVRFRADVIDINADAVVILAGTNDIAGNTGPVTLKMILNNLKSMTEIAQSNGVEVILCSVLPAYDYPWSPGKEPNIKIPILNSMIKDFAKENDCSVHMPRIGCGLAGGKWEDVEPRIKNELIAYKIETTVYDFE